MNSVKFVFFGSANFSVKVLDELVVGNTLPSLIVTTPDKPQGRKLILTPNPVKVWAQEHSIPVITELNKEKLKEERAVFFLVVAYGKILKKEIFEIPQFKTLNIHPSLLPKYRGASPMISQMLNDEKEMGTSIMLVDEGMDTGPVLGQKRLASPQPLSKGEGHNPPLGGGQGGADIQELENMMAKESVSLLLEILPDYLAGKIEPQSQNESEATYCQKIKKEDGLLDLSTNPRKNLLKIKAFSVWPRTYFIHNGKRIIVTDAELDSENKLKILRVIPEGKKEMPYEDFLRGQK